MSSPSGSPFADVIQSLAGLHQEHHKALMDMRADQERRFCALVQNQREDRELFRSWMDREVRAGESPTALAPPTHMPVQKMGPQDDPEAFLDLFEKVIGRSPYHHYPKKSQPSQRRLDCTNLSRFRLGCSGRPLPFSASWTKSSDRTPHTPLPTWMTSSSTVRTGSGTWCTCGRCWERWGERD